MNDLTILVSMCIFCSTVVYSVHAIKTVVIARETSKIQAEIIREILLKIWGEMLPLISKITRGCGTKNVTP